MKATVRSTQARKTYVLDVEDGPIRDMPYSRVGGRYKVTRIEVVKQNGNVSSITLHGNVLKKDGTEGLNAASEGLYGNPDGWPQGLSRIVRGLA